ncbi:MAG: TIGR02921 family PEP-CTERM protein [Deltaproteobacteria bacterium]|nr:TIGR02921 family PEP-CTERM protein [Deltaproteobacteria bacterium]
MNTLRRYARFTLNALFWPWNIVLCCVAIFGYVPFALLDLVVDAVDGLARWDFVMGSLIMVAVPPATLAYAWMHKQHFKEEPSELAVLFFGVELPLLACTAARLFGFQQLTGAAQLVYVALVAGGVVAESRLILGKHLPRIQLVEGVAHGLLVMRAIAGAYVGFVLASMSLPVLMQGLMKVADAAAVDGGPFLFVAFILSPLWLFLGASALLVLTLPITAPVSWFFAVKRSGAALRAAYGVDDFFFASAAPVLVAGVCMYLFFPQPHVAAFRALEKLPQNDDERRALVAQREEISAGLLDAYLGKHYYVADNANDTWARLWSFEGSLAQAHELGALDETMNEVARPFTYDGRLPDAKRAAQLYRDFFGRELERDHGAAVRDALSATWSQEERFAGFINEGQQRVRLATQQVTGKAHDGVVDVEVHDEWVNQTGNDEEVALFFELPESAAVTGLWLSPTSDKSDGAKFVVAPRGAAQQMYQEEVKAKRDPALLEQVGPRQYRLRVFPVPARPARRKNVFGVPSSASWAGPEAPRVHVWMSYQTLPDAKGNTPMPVLRERRNGFWDQNTTRTVNGEALVAVDAVFGGGWVQGAVEETVQRSEVAVDVDDVCLKLVPAPAPVPRLSGMRVDVVIDRSLDLAAHKQALQDSLEALGASGTQLRYVLGTSAMRGEPASVADAVDVDDLVFFGAARPKELLRQLIELRGSNLGDAIVVLSGSASFDVADDSKLDLGKLKGRPLPPTALVHVSGSMPSGYDDATLDALRRSGGNATGDIGSALARLSSAPRPWYAGGGPSKQRGEAWVDGYNVVVDGTCPGSKGALAVGARQRILAADRGGLAPLTALDRLHRVAVNAGVVTPYSSMIVLMTQTQLARLGQINQGDDRFDREVEGATKADALAGARKIERPAEPKRERRGESKSGNTLLGMLGKAGAPPPPPSAPTASMVAPSVVSDDVAGDKDTAKAVAKPQAMKESVEAQSEPTLPSADMPAPTDPSAEKANTAPTTTTTTPPPPPAVPEVSGVPEPEEWLLLILAGVAVVWFERRRRLAL